MDCRDFRNRHLAFTDNTLSEVEVVAMQAHLAACERCSRYDTVMRRGLLVLRNLPTIEPSPEFLDRLNLKLRHLQRADARAALYRGPSIGSFVATAASVVAIGFLAAAMLNRIVSPAKDLVLAPVVATRPAPLLPPLINSDFVASASVGLPVWPAAMVAEQAPVHFADAELRLASK